jgi:hypothetical protein
MEEADSLSTKRRRLKEGGFALLLFFLASLGGEGEYGVLGMAAILPKWPTMCWSTIIKGVLVLVAW